MLGAVIGVGAQLLGGRQARKAQRRAEAENRRAVAEQNRLNEEANARQNQWNADQVTLAFDRSSQAAETAFLRNKMAIAEQNAYNDPSQVRARAEAAGFNPLSFVGAGVGQQAGAAQMIAPGAAAAQGAPVSYAASMVTADNFGSAISNAGLLLADGVNAAAQEKALSTKLAQENAELRKAFNSATLRPEVPGIYGTVQPVTVPKNPSGRTTSTIDGGTFDTVKDWFTAASAYGNRVYEEAPVKSLALLADVELPNGEKFPVPHDGDEIMGIEKFPALAGGYAVKKAIEWGGGLKNWTDSKGWTPDGPLWEYLPPLQYLPNRYQPGWYGSEAQKKYQRGYNKSFWDSFRPTGF